MSINHFSSSELNFLHTPSLWCPPQHPHLHNNFMEEEENQASNLSSKEHLFEKPLTPSDVGKLNRLVIPKQHAERYFPLGGEAGLVLAFEDESGKSWKFRYSYWNSSQSYVLTKGWSRYVKEKKLDAGDVVLFQRIGERVFIGWRRRGDGNNSTGVSGGDTRGGVSCSSSSIANNNNNRNDIIIEQFQTNGFPRPATSFGNPRRLRLFGVNLECQGDEQSSEPSTPDGSSMSSEGLTHHHHQFYNFQPAYSYSSNSPSHMASDK